jgi:hypothetical protein
MGEGPDITKINSIKNYLLPHLKYPDDESKWPWTRPKLYKQVSQQFSQKYCKVGINSMNDLPLLEKLFEEYLRGHKFQISLCSDGNNILLKNSSEPTGMNIWRNYLDSVFKSLDFKYKDCLKGYETIRSKWVLIREDTGHKVVKILEDLDNIDKLDIQLFSPREYLFPDNILEITISRLDPSKAERLYYGYGTPLKVEDVCSSLERFEK